MGKGLLQIGVSSRHSINNVKAMRRQSA